MKTIYYDYREYTDETTIEVLLADRIIVYLFFSTQEIGIVGTTLHWTESSFWLPRFNLRYINRRIRRRNRVLMVDICSFKPLVVYGKM